MFGCILLSSPATVDTHYLEQVGRHSGITTNEIYIIVLLIFAPPQNIGSSATTSPSVFVPRRTSKVAERFFFPMTSHQIAAYLRICESIYLGGEIANTKNLRVQRAHRPACNTVVRSPSKNKIFKVLKLSRYGTILVYDIKHDEQL